MKDNAREFLRRRWDRNWPSSPGISATEFVRETPDETRPQSLCGVSSLDLGRPASSSRLAARSFGEKGA